MSSQNVQEILRSFILTELREKLNLPWFACAQPEIFQGRGDFVKLEHFDKYFVKISRIKSPEGKILEFFSPRYS